MSRKGFTLIELMIVVLILGILLAIAVPQWVKVRESSQRRSCLANVKQIENAKEHLSMEMHLANGSHVNQGDIYPDYIRGASFPECPASGSYAIGNIGEPATCSVHGGL